MKTAYVVMGTNGSLAVPTMPLRRYPRKEERSWFEPFQSETIPLQRTNPLAAQIEHFVAVIRGSADPLITARDGLQSLRVTDAILEAARTGATVKISAKEA
jgi:predicted dehydrogenase